MGWTILILLIQFLVILATLARLLQKRKQKGELENAEGYPYTSTRPLELQVAEGTYFYRYVPPVQREALRSPPAIELWVPARSAGAFCIAKQSAWDDFFKTAGFTQAVELKLPDLDGRVFIVSPSPEEAAVFWKTGAHAEALRRLLRLGVTEVEHDGVTLKLRWKPCHQNLRVQSLPFVDEAGRLLLSLAPSLGAAFRRADAGRVKSFLTVQQGLATRWGAWMGFLFALTIAAVTVSFLFYRPVYWVALARAVALIALPAVALFLIGVRRYLRSSAMRGRAVFQLLLYGTLTVCGLVATGVILVNAKGDDGPISAHLCRVKRTWVTYHKGNRHYHASVESWHDPGESLDIDIQSRDYRELRHGGRRLEVRTRPGRLGIEWIAGHRTVAAVVEPCSDDRCIEEAYVWARIKRAEFSPGASVSDEERRFLAEFFKLLDWGVANRIWSVAPLLDQSPPFEPPFSYEELGNRLERLRPPSRLWHAHALVVEAVREHGRFLRKWQHDSGLNPYAQGHPLDPLLADASQKLRVAYQNLLDAYPEESAQNKQAFYSHLCAIDFI